MAEIASAFVSLMPSAKGFGSKLDSQISGDINKAGKKGGLSFGKLFAAGAALGIGAKAFSFLGDSLAEATDAAVVGSRTENVIAKMGNAANISAKQVGTLAAAISNKTGIDDEAIQAGQNLLLTFGNVRNEAGKGNDIFNQTSKLMVDMSAAMGTDAKGSAIQLGKALNDPVKGLTALSRVGVSFTEGQKAQIESMVEAGNTMGAQKVILGELERQFGGAAAAMTTPAEKAKVAWGNLKEQIGTAILPLFNRVATTISTRIIPAVSSFIASFRSGSGPVSAFGSVVGRVVAAVRTLSQWFTGSVVPAVRSALIPVIARGRVEFAKLQAAVEDNRPQLMQLLNGFKAVANFIGTKVLPVLAVLRGVAFVALIAAIRGVINAIGAGVSAFNSIRSAIITAADTVGRFNSAVREKIGAALSFIQGVPGRILAIFASAPTLLYNAGVQLMTGLASGITNKIEDAINAVRSGLSRIAGMMPGSPIKWGPLKSWNGGGAGKKLMDMVALGITKGTPKTIKAAEEAFGKIGDALKSTRSDLQSTLEGLKSDFASLADSVAQAFTGDLFGVTATEAVKASAGVAAVAAKSVGENFISNLTAKKGELTGLLSSFTTLKGWGLDPAFLSQLFASGNGALITELAGMGQAGALNAGSLFKDVTTLGSQLGGAVATNDPVTSRIDETNRLLTTVSGQLGYLGSDIGKELNSVAAKAQRDKKNKKGRK